MMANRALLQTPDEVRDWLKTLPNDFVLLCPFTGQFIKCPIVAGTVNQQWLAANSAKFERHRVVPKMGEPTIKSRYDPVSYPVSFLQVCPPVNGERNRRSEELLRFDMEIAQRDQKIQQTTQQLARADQGLQSCVQELNALRARNQELERRLQVSESTVLTYAELVQSMQICIYKKELKEQEQQPRDTSEVERLRNSQMELSAQVITLQEQKEQSEGVIEVMKRDKDTMEKEILELKEKIQVLESEQSPESLEPPGKRARVTFVTPPPSTDCERIEFEERKMGKENTFNFRTCTIEDRDEVNENLKNHKLKAVFKFTQTLNGLTLFGALSDQLKRDFGIEKSPADLLSKLVKHLKLPAPRMKFEKKLKEKEPNSKFSHFLESIGNGATSELIVDAMAHCLRKNISIYSADEIHEYSHYPSSSISLKLAFYTGEKCYYRSTENFDNFIEID